MSKSQEHLHPRQSGEPGSSEDTSKPGELPILYPGGWRDAAFLEQAQICRQMFESTHDVIQSVAPDGRFVFVNASWLRTLGYTTEDLPSLNLFDVVRSEDAPGCREALDRVLTGATVQGLEATLLGKDGSGIAVEGHATPLRADGRILGAHVFFRDVSERRRFERALEQRMAQQQIVARLGGRALRGAELSDLLAEAVRLIADNLGVALCAVLERQPGGTEVILRAGWGFRPDLVGLWTAPASPDDHAGFVLRSPDPVIFADLTSEERFRPPPLFRNHSVVSGVSVVVGREKRPYGLLSALATRQREFSLEDVYFIEGVANVLGEAVDNRRHVEELARRDSLAKLGELSAIVAHELKNPLAGIIGAAGMLKRRLADGSFEREIAEEMLDRTQALSRTVQDILLLARPRDPEIQGVPMHLLLEDIVSLVKTDPQFSNVETVLTCPPLSVPCDVEMLRPVFLNLLINSAQAMEGRGTIRLELKADDSTGLCEVTVTDTGPGIDSETLDRVFEPFFTTKPGGTGLGLSIARRVVELHGGELRITSGTRGATTFSIRLPLRPEGRSGGAAADRG